MKRSVAHLLFLTLVAAFWPAALAQETNQAALVVFAGGEVVTRCVEFGEAQISGFELLNRSGLVVEAGGGNLGAAVCRIEETGCPAGNCFCHCSGADCEYWSYWHLLDGEWRYSQIGASAYRVGAGAVEGWSWGPASPDEAPAPPLLTFGDVCGPDQVTEATGAITALPETTATAPGAAGEWLAYGLLGLIVAGLAAALLIAQRRSSGR